MMMGALLWWVLEIVSGHLAQVMQPWFLCLAGTGFNYPNFPPLSLDRYNTQCAASLDASSEIRRN